jgi:CDP-diacylglycerol---glycerol-3-phosphate 3-phosphatidyltransferase
MNWANRITLIRLCLIPIFLIFLTPVTSKVLQISPDVTTIIATIIFLLAAATDKLDGYIARKFDQVTKLGKLLDPLVDKLLIIAGLIILVDNHKIASWIAFVIIGREIVITSLRTLAILRNVVLAADQFGKIKMVVQVLAISLVLLNNQALSIFVDYHLDQIMMLLAAALTVFSGINYMMKNRQIFIS